MACGGNSVLQCICCFGGGGRSPRSRRRLGEHETRCGKNETTNRKDEDRISNEEATMGKHEARMGKEESLGKLLALFPK
jgi:hypothetical protein